MKKFLFFFIFILALLSLNSCKEKAKENPLYSKMMEVSKEYFKAEAPDSVKIIKIDTISSMGYAKIMLEMLENMKIDFENQYHTAMKSGDEALGVEIEYSIEEIYQVSEALLYIINDDKTPEDNLLLYMVTATYYQKELPSTILFFTTDDFKIHDLDPFGNNLLQL